MKAIKSCIREHDDVIRMGGDEFLVILKLCNIQVANRIICMIKDSLKTDVVYDKAKNNIANFGMSHTTKFVCSPVFIANMLDKADENMYLEKRNSIQTSDE